MTLNQQVFASYIIQAQLRPVTGEKLEAGGRESEVDCAPLAAACSIQARVAAIPPGRTGAEGVGTTAACGTVPTGAEVRRESRRHGGGIAEAAALLRASTGTGQIRSDLGQDPSRAVAPSALARCGAPGRFRLISATRPEDSCRGGEFACCASR